MADKKESREKKKARKKAAGLAALATVGTAAAIAPEAAQVIYQRTEAPLPPSQAAGVTVPEPMRTEYAKPRPLRSIWDFLKGVFGTQTASANPRDMQLRTPSIPSIFPEPFRGNTDLRYTPEPRTPAPPIPGDPQGRFRIPAPTPTPAPPQTGIPGSGGGTGGTAGGTPQPEPARTPNPAPPRAPNPTPSATRPQGHLPTPGPAVTSDPVSRRAPSPPSQTPEPAVRPGTIPTGSGRHIAGDDSGPGPAPQAPAGEPAISPQISALNTQAERDSARARELLSDLREQINNAPREAAARQASVDRALAQAGSFGINISNNANLAAAVTAFGTAQADAAAYNRDLAAWIAAGANPADVPVFTPGYAANSAFPGLSPGGTITQSDFAKLNPDQQAGLIGVGVTITPDSPSGGSGGTGAAANPQGAGNAGSGAIPGLTPDGTITLSNFSALSPDQQAGLIGVGVTITPDSPSGGSGAGAEDY